jgi:hypothetical protein
METNAMSDTTVFGSLPRRGDAGREGGRRSREMGADRIDRGVAL